MPAASARAFPGKGFPTVSRKQVVVVLEEMKEQLFVQAR